jgi:hypothetical protein
MYNIMTCDGNMCWLTFIITLALAAVLRRQCQDGVLAGTPFNTIGGFGVGLGLNIIMTTLFGDPRWSLLAGIAGVAIGGFLLGMILPSGDGESA